MNAPLGANWCWIWNEPVLVLNFTVYYRRIRPVILVCRRSHCCIRYAKMRHQECTQFTGCAGNVRHIKHRIWSILSKRSPPRIGSTQFIIVHRPFFAYQRFNPSSTDKRRKLIRFVVRLFQLFNFLQCWKLENYKKIVFRSLKSRTVKVMPFYEDDFTEIRGTSRIRSVFALPEEDCWTIRNANGLMPI